MRRLSLVLMVSVVLSLAFYAFQIKAAHAQNMEKTPAKAAASGPKVPASGTALWDYLKKEDYEKNWKMWPGKTAFYPGTQPHGVLLTTYVNPVALKAIEAKTGALPDGSIIVKENYSSEKWLESLTVMYKVKGFNPGANDWFWAKYGSEGTIAAEGRIDMCIECHGKRRANDFIQTAPLK